MHQLYNNENIAHIEQIWRNEMSEKRYLLEQRRFSELPLCSRCTILDYNYTVQNILKIQMQFPKLWNASLEALIRVRKLYQSVRFRG